MDQYADSHLVQRDTSSRTISNTSSNMSTKPQDGPSALPYQTSFPSGSRSDNNAAQSGEKSGIDAEYAQYTDAPPPFSEKQYEGKSEEEQTQMRKDDYAKEIKRMMGKQLVRGLKGGASKE